MRDARILADDNAAILRQGIDLLERLDDEQYAADPVGNGRDGAGKQFRHCIDFCNCCLDGLEKLRIDYGNRARDSRLEQDRGFAVRTLHELVDRLRGLRIDQDTEVRVKVYSLDEAEAADLWSRSSAMRELQFLRSHTIHHYALIKWILRVQGFEVHQDFGVAPSTLRHWREVSLLAE